VFLTKNFNIWTKQILRELKKKSDNFPIFCKKHWSYKDVYTLQKYFWKCENKYKETVRTNNSILKLTISILPMNNG
jgi:hypothetical protein